jgi:hypothetical protein
MKKAERMKVRRLCASRRFRYLNADLIIQNAAGVSTSRQQGRMQTLETKSVPYLFMDSKSSPRMPRSAPNTSDHEVMATTSTLKPMLKDTAAAKSISGVES